ncbi:hypothetical protein CCHL11_10406 [Colletotrichum chlorophyti]|uniref:BZIP domain-containing protein n=1 Tax=Colletotrichum chlorophyti TaxID=708187 RepID=A0A1Q8RB15_9PEZI|nr:hypothetical protein CCHL11_10406 [Colletotrichum chlorophyti]
MSQRGPAPHASPRRPSQSPPRPFHGSQQFPLSQDNAPGQTSQDATSPSERHSMGSRSLGIQGLINPSEVKSERRTTESPQSRTVDVQSSPYGMHTQPYGTPGDRHYTFQGQGAPSQPATPAGYPTTTPLGHTPSDYGSPRSGFPFPAMGSTRQMLSPRETRAASVGQASFRGPEQQQTPFLPPTAPRGKRAYPGDEGPADPHRATPRLPFSGPPSLGFPQSAMGSLTTTPQRTMSQPMIGHPVGSQLPPLPRGAPDYQGPPQGFPQGSNVPPPQPQAVPVWSAPGAGTPLYQSLRSDVAKAGAEGGVTLAMGGGSGGGIIVPVDCHGGSKQADEKRQRNAGASARFRQRKKEKDQSTVLELQRLQVVYREMESRMRDLTQERDFYRDERNRLRDVVLRTPLSDMANGPPSPSSSRSGESMKGTSPLTQAPLLPHQSQQQQQQGYASSEASSVERPKRRRRTDSAPTPEFSVPSYGAPVTQQGSLPPLQAPVYGMVPQRPPSTTPGGERLPPLRAMEGHYGAPDSGPATTAGGPLYPSYTRVPHETGFANRNTGPPTPTGGYHGYQGYDGHQR